MHSYTCWCEMIPTISRCWLIPFSDAEDTQYVYAWRREQEAAMRASKGTGMTDEQVINFVNGCELDPSAHGVHGR